MRDLWRSTVASLSQLPMAAHELAPKLPASGVVCFRGEMGAGKTTFIRALCEALGVSDTVTSPTFSIINEYRTANAASVYHFDFYRLKSIFEAQSIGCEDYLYDPHALCLLEWPDRIEAMLPDERIEVTIALEGQTRHFTAVAIP